MAKRLWYPGWPISFYQSSRSKSNLLKWSTLWPEKAPDKVKVSSSFSAPKPSIYLSLQKRCRKIQSTSLLRWLGDVLWWFGVVLCLPLLYIACWSSRWVQTALGAADVKFWKTLSILSAPARRLLREFLSRGHDHLYNVLSRIVILPIARDAWLCLSLWWCASWCLSYRRSVALSINLKGNSRAKLSISRKGFQCTWLHVYRTVRRLQNI